MKLERLVDMDDSWALRKARHGFPVLVEFARRRSEITYTEWDAEIAKKLDKEPGNPRLYGGPAWWIGEACEGYAKTYGIKVPSINLIVVRKRTRLPGEGAIDFIARFCSDFLDPKVKLDELSDREKRSIIERAHTEIFNFQKWPEVLRAHGLPKARSFTNKKKRRRPKPSEWHTGPESEEHKDLKRLIADCPTVIGLKHDKKGEQEYQLLSGDKVDVYFNKPATAVEVKTSSASFSELLRGIFQCVKYKSVLEAQQIYDRKIPLVDCILAIGGQLPKNLRETLGILNIRCYERLAKQL